MYESCVQFKEISFYVNEFIFLFFNFFNLKKKEKNQLNLPAKT